MRRAIAIAAVSTLISTSVLAQEDTPRTSRALNPDTGVNFLGLFRRGVSGNDSASTSPNGFHFQEAELQFSADVDPYVRAAALFSIGEVEPVPGHEHEFAFEPEEVYLETLNIPAHTFRLGKFKAALGRHNTLHTHAFPFIDAPLINQTLLGEEGLNDIGLSGSVLIPAPWFLEFTAQALSGKAELYDRPEPNHFAGVTQLKSLWDLNDDSTLDVDLFGTWGYNSFGSKSHVLGADLTFKWRPTVGGKSTALAWTTEYLNGFRGLDPSGERVGGLASWIQYQFSERWWVQARGEFQGLGRSEGLPATRKQSVLLGFLPSEFSGYRLQYDHVVEDGLPEDHVVTLQWNISIGAHPAHAY